MNFKRVKGTKDYYEAERFKFEKTITLLSTLVSNFNYKKIIFPILETIDLFKRSLGDDIDIVNKEMFTLKNKKGKTLVLRPEGTVPATRLVLENKLAELGEQQKLFYIGSMYRYERPQKGRSREFYQLGIENFNANSIYDDVEAIQVGERILQSLGIDKFELKINSIGSIETRKKYENELKNYFLSYRDKLSLDSKKRLEKNVLRILDSKEDVDIEITKNAPSILNFLSKDEQENFNKIKELIDQLEIKYKIDDKLIRGLDYYNDLVFEFISTDTEKVGSKATLIGGGRYDGLVSHIDPSKKYKAIGFAAGIERLMLAAEDTLNKLKETIDYFVVTTDEKYSKEAMLVADILRKRYVTALNLSSQSLGKKLSKAEKLNTKKVVIIGREIEKNKVIVKDFKKLKQKIIKINEIGEL